MDIFIPIPEKEIRDYIQLNPEVQKNGEKLKFFFTNVEYYRILLNVKKPCYPSIIIRKQNSHEEYNFQFQKILEVQQTKDDLTIHIHKLKSYFVNQV